MCGTGSMRCRSPFSLAVSLCVCNITGNVSLKVPYCILAVVLVADFLFCVIYANDVLKVVMGEGTLFFVKTLPKACF